MFQAADTIKAQPDAPSVSAQVTDFAGEEEGGIIAWSLFTIIAMFMAVGIGIDAMRTEALRTHMQNTLDRAVLAAADLEQQRTPLDVVTDYFDRSGLPSSAANIEATSRAGEKVVSAQLNAELDGYLIDLIGNKSFPAMARGEAREAITDVEIALVLDNSGSMGWNNDRRLNLLKPAAKDFIDQVMKPGPNGEPSTVSLSLVPFSTQVNAGSVLGGALSLSDEHSYSHCVEFDDTSYSSTSIDPEAALRRAGHFDVFTWDSPVDTFGVVCPFDASRQITPFSRSPEVLKAQIDAMWAGGNTSIDIAAKWGAALLDPAFRPVVDGLIDDGDVDGAVAGRPYDYGRENTMKVLVVMSDGQNTQEFQLRDAYRSGKSTVWRNPDDGIVSYFDADRGEYFVFNAADVEDAPGGTWQPEPGGEDAAVNLEWVDVWNKWSVAVWARYIKDPAMGGGWESHYDAVYRTTNASDKNSRASAICEAFRTKDEKAIIYTVGMDTYGQGDDTLEDCAGTPLNFFDVDAEEVDEAFSAIARQINMLRLTQ